MKNHLLILFFLLNGTFFLNSISFADDDNKTQRSTYKEITKTDITRYSDILSSEILVFGISFKMTMEEATDLVATKSNIFFKVDPFNNTRYYLFDSEKIDGKNTALAYFIWDDQGIMLNEIILYKGFSKFLVGRSQELLTVEVINKNSGLVKDFMGYPAKKETTLDLPSIGLKTYSYFYPNHNFKIIRNFSDEGNSIAFSMVREIIY